LISNKDQEQIKLITLITNKPKIKYLDISNRDLSGNPLTSIDLSRNSKLKKISLADCLTTNQDLSVFSHLKDLEYLNINKTPFFGSLKTLTNSKLNSLKI